MQQFPNRNKASDFSKPEVQQAFTEDAKSSKSLLQKELDVNQAEQILLRQRIELMKSFLNDIPSSDPHYSMFAAQMRMDQIEIDELKVRELSLSEKLTEG